MPSQFAGPITFAAAFTLTLRTLCRGDNMSHSSGLADHVGNTAIYEVIRLEPLELTMSLPDHGLMCSCRGDRSGLFQTAAMLRSCCHANTVSS